MRGQSSYLLTFVRSAFLSFGIEQGFVFLQRLFEDFQCFFHGAVVFAARGVQMSASAEEFGCQLVAGELAHRAQGYLDHRLLGVFTQEAGEDDVLDAERDVDKSFAVAPDVIELLLLLAGK